MRYAFASALLIILAILSVERNTVWTDDGTLWLDTIRRSPQKARGYNELGLHAIQAHNYELAIDAFTRSLGIDPYLPHAYINLGLAYEGLNRTDMAIRTYEKAMDIDPGDPTAYYNLGLLYYRVKKDRQKALGLFLKARDLNPLEPDVHQHLGDIYRDIGKSELSNEEYLLFRKLK